MTDPCWSNRAPPAKTVEQIAEDIRTALNSQPWGPVPRLEIISPEEYRRQYEQQVPAP